MIYPRTPAGLNKAEHYEFANTLLYAIADTLEISPPRLIRAEPDPKPEPQIKRKHVKKASVPRKVALGGKRVA